MTRRNLILIHRGPEYEQDFKEISEKVFAIDSDITVYSLATGSTDQLPVAAWRRPTLTVALSSAFNLEVRRGPVLKNRQIDKLAQHKIFQQAGLSTPPTMAYRCGMTLDPILLGRFVLIKPMDLKLTSKGDGIHLFRRERLQGMGPADFDAKHKIHQDRKGYLVSRFIYTGKYPSYYRILTFCGQVLYIMKHLCTVPTPDLDDADHVIERGNVTAKFNKNFFLEQYPEHFALGQRVAEAMSDIPLLGIDVAVEESTGTLFVLEANPGGNTWHFSSPSSKERREQLPDLVPRMKAQYGAFDIAAKALVQKTHLMAA